MLQGEPKIVTGCISWTYPDWLGSFYPLGTKSSRFLALYSRTFDIVEIDSTFYRTPNLSTVKQWKERTPSNFLFTAKLPKKITHDSRLKGVSDSIKSFENIFRALSPKLACIFAQMPPSFKFDSGFETLAEFLDTVDPHMRCAIEFRHESWFRKEAFDLLRRKNVCFVWSVNEYSEKLTPEITSDFLYLRFRGEFGEFKKFDHMQADKTNVLEKWCRILTDNISSVERAFVLVSNHFAGFAPDTVNQFRKIAGMDEANWRERMASLSNPTLS